MKKYLQLVFGTAKAVLEWLMNLVKAVLSLTVQLAAKAGKLAAKFTGKKLKQFAKKHRQEILVIEMILSATALVAALVSFFMARKAR